MYVVLRNTLLKNMAECGGSYSSVVYSETTEELRPQSGEPINILVIGKYKVGKSTLINSLFFQEGQEYRLIAKEEFLKPTKSDLYTLIKDGVEYHIHESPGYGNGSDNEGYEYFRKISYYMYNMQAAALHVMYMYMHHEWS